jgi:hypothetical protein
LFLPGLGLVDPVSRCCTLVPRRSEQERVVTILGVNAKVKVEVPRPIEERSHDGALRGNFSSGQVERAAKYAFAFGLGSAAAVAGMQDCTLH